MTIYKWTDCFMASRCDMKFDCATCNIYKAHCRCKAEVADYKPPSREYRRGNDMEGEGITEDVLRKRQEDFLQEEAGDGL